MHVSASELCEEDQECRTFAARDRFNYYVRWPLPRRSLFLTPLARSTRRDLS